MRLSLTPQGGGADGYDVAFDVIDRGHQQWWFAAAPLILFAVGVVILIWDRQRRLNLFRRRLVALTTVGCLLLGLSLFGSTYATYRELKEALRVGRAEYVAGTVEHVHPMPVEGHAMESFEVNGKRFEYSDFVLTAGFNNTRAHGGPIRDGLRVKIWHVDDTIVRLEVERNQ